MFIGRGRNVFEAQMDAQRQADNAETAAYFSMVMAPMVNNVVSAAFGILLMAVVDLVLFVAKPLAGSVAAALAGVAFGLIGAVFWGARALIGPDPDLLFIAYGVVGLLAVKPVADVLLGIPHIIGALEMREALFVKDVYAKRRWAGRLLNWLLYAASAAAAAALGHTAARLPGIAFDPLWLPPGNTPEALSAAAAAALLAVAARRFWHPVKKMGIERWRKEPFETFHVSEWDMEVEMERQRLLAQFERQRAKAAADGASRKPR